MTKIILLRGLGREQRHWDDDFLNMLKRRDLEPVLIDLPGAGNYRHILSPTQIEDYVAFLQNQFIEIFKPNEKVFLLGHSLGGMVAIRWAFEYPENFSQLFLVNTSDKRSRTLPDRLRPFGLWKLANILRKDDIKEKEREVLEMISNNKEAARGVLEKWVRLACERPIKTLSLVNQVWAASHFQAPSHLDVPAAYITSKADRMVSYKCSEKLAKQHKASIYRHTKAGHDIPLDDPEWLADILGSFAK